MPPPGHPPQLLFVHEWWRELRDDLRLAGVLFTGPPSPGQHPPPEVEQTMFDRAQAHLLATHIAAAFPTTPHQIIYGIWFERERNWVPWIGPVMNDDWLAPLRDGAAGGDSTGVVHIVRVPRTARDRAADPSPAQA